MARNVNNRFRRRRAVDAALYRGQSTGARYPRLLESFGGGNREVRVYQTGPKAFRVYLLAGGATFASAGFKSKAAAMAKARAWR